MSATRGRRRTGARPPPPPHPTRAGGEPAARRCRGPTLGIHHVGKRGARRLPRGDHAKHDTDCQRRGETEHHDPPVERGRYRRRQQTRRNQRRRRPEDRGAEADAQCPAKHREHEALGRAAASRCVRARHRAQTAPRSHGRAPSPARAASWPRSHSTEAARSPPRPTERSTSSASRCRRCRRGSVRR